MELRRASGYVISSVSATLITGGENYRSCGPRFHRATRIPRPRLLNAAPF